MWERGFQLRLLACLSLCHLRMQDLPERDLEWRPKWGVSPRLHWVEERIPMTHFARPPEMHSCQPLPGKALPSHTTSFPLFQQSPLWIVTCASFQKFLYKNKHIWIHLSSPAWTLSIPTEVFFHSSPSLDTEIRCPLFHLRISLLYGCWLYTVYWLLSLWWTFGLFWVFIVMNNMCIMPLSLQSCTGRTVRWIPGNRIGVKVHIFRCY